MWSLWKIIITWYPKNTHIMVISDERTKLKSFPIDLPHKHQNIKKNVVIRKYNSTAIWWATSDEADECHMKWNLMKASSALFWINVHIVFTLLGLINYPPSDNIHMK